MPYLKTMLTPF